MIHSALKQVNRYNLPRQTTKELIDGVKEQDGFYSGIVSLFFGMYILFLILPFNSEASIFFHLVISMISLCQHLNHSAILFCCCDSLYSRVPYHERIFGQIPLRILKAIHLFGTIAGVFNMSVALEGKKHIESNGESLLDYSFDCILSAIFIGCSDWLPIVIVFLRALYRDCIKLPEPVEIHRAKKTIQNIKQFFFVGKQSIVYI